MLEPVASQPGHQGRRRHASQRGREGAQDPADRERQGRGREGQARGDDGEVADKYPTYIVVDRSNFTLTLYRNLKHEKQYTVAIGARGLRHPDRAVPHPGQAGRPCLERPGLRLGGRSSPARRSRPAPRTRSRPAGWASTTAPASTAPPTPPRSAAPPRTAACGWSIPDVIDLYDRVDVGTPIYIG